MISLEKRLEFIQADSKRLIQWLLNTVILKEKRVKIVCIYNTDVTEQELTQNVVLEELLAGLEPIT